MRRIFLAGLAAGLLALGLTSCGEPPTAVDADGSAALVGGLPMQTIDFEGLPAGTILASVYGDAGAGPVTVFGRNPNAPNTNHAVIFDSANPTGGDFDLGTPNQACGGPGNGTQVGPGTPFENCTPLGNLLIVAQNLVDGNGDGLVDNPDDIDSSALDGVWVSLDYSALGTVTVYGIDVVDLDGNGPNPRVELLGPGGASLGTFPLPNMPNNGVAHVTLGPTAGVEVMKVWLQGSGAFDNVVFAPPQQPELGEIGDFVWCDLNNDGIQDPGEPGLEGVVVNLTCTLPDGSTLTDSRTTDANGWYLFTDVPAGDCHVEVDVNTAPMGCDQIGECPLDYDIQLAEGESYLDADFCFWPMPPTGDEGCTPGYWKNHEDAWPPTGYSPAQSLSSVFSEVSAFPNLGSKSLLEALSFHGGNGEVGGARILLRAAVAALLNASHPEVDYTISEADVIQDVNAALATMDRGTMLWVAYNLDMDNNLGCPLN